ncbi:MAG: enoyl-CoA hydratase/isomerase family protein [Vicinamibacterales bacterium]
MSPVAVLSEHHGSWLRLVMDQPPGNLLSVAMVRALREALRDIAGRPAVKWVTIEGAGDEFSYGAKIQEHLPDEMRVVLPETHEMLRQWLACAAPTAALVRGRCLGGGFELALACDDILATADASFGLPEVKLSAFPPAAAAFLPARVGATRASRAIVSGAIQPASYWHDAGLVSVMAPPNDLADAAAEWFVRHLAPHSAAALSHAARAARLMLIAHALPVIEAAERLYLDSLLNTEDAREGVEAFIDKRPPTWKNR